MGERFQEQPSNKSATLEMALRRAQKKRLQKKGNEINDHKRNKEYQVMTDIVLLQVAAENYTLEPEDPFQAWFQAMESLSEAESYTLSCQLEPRS
ncbi:ral guanine nucleotide dissociation stimulator-like isoform X1 [Ursus americanus]|uniref:ral guanine nucleotide dissociation stimulator-like isoform X1 n=1 Tax=Ursus americanus TaxID=9643 RepID=UPI001E67D41C|nr:ral guanine nucleotide dissociation stimulator-like isoform X1 [Ursus americanus]